MTGSSEPTFNKPYSTHSFIVLMAATLFVFSMTTSQSLLPIVLGARGFSESTIGYAMSITVLPVLFFGLLSGLFISKYGPLNGIMLGVVLAVVAHISFDFLPARESSLYLSRFLHGTAVGFLLPAIITLAKAMLTGPKQVINFAIFTSVIPGANLIGPPFGDLYFQTYGSEGYFLATAIPGGISVLLFGYLRYRYGLAEVKHVVVIGYLRILKRAEIFIPLYGMIFPALLWGYFLSYAALGLSAQGMKIGAFFSATAISLIAGRFVMLKVVASLSKEQAVLAAILIMSWSLVQLTLFTGIGVTLLSGVLFGLSYSIIYPTLSMWVANEVDEADKPQAIALTNTMFNTFMYVTPLICGYLLSYMDIISFQFYFAILVALFATCFFVLGMWSARQKE